MNWKRLTLWSGLAMLFLILVIPLYIKGFSLYVVGVDLSIVQIAWVESLVLIVWGICYATFKDIHEDRPPRPLTPRR